MCVCMYVRVCRGFDISENTSGHGHYLVMSEVKLKFKETQSKHNVEKFDHELIQEKKMESRYNREVSAKWLKVRGLELYVCMYERVLRCAQDI